jgi:hypothetical protein
MIGDHHHRTAARATLLVTAVDEILGTHKSEAAVVPVGPGPPCVPASGTPLRPGTSRCVPGRSRLVLKQAPSTSDTTAQGHGHAADRSAVSTMASLLA